MQSKAVLNTGMLAVAGLVCLALTGCRQKTPVQQPKPQTATTQPSITGLPAPPSSQMVTRSLLPEIDEAKFGAAAQVRTRFGHGSGLVLPQEHEVLAHLHVVLSPTKTIADRIFVTMSASPEPRRDELAAYAVAQDPTHDLVLLKVGTRPAYGAPGGPDAQPPVEKNRNHHRRRRERRRRSSTARAGDAPDSNVKNKSPRKVKTRVVIDGPNNSGANRS